MKDTEQTNFDKRLAFVMARLRALATPFVELFYGIKTRTLPWEYCAGVFVVIGVLIACRVDVWAFRKTGYAFLYPRNPYLYWTYFATLAGSGFLAWAGLQTGRRRRLAKDLTEAFNCAGLKNRMGKVPNFIFDKPLDAFTRKLKVTNARLPLAEFRKAKDTIESALQIYVDDIKEERIKGTVEMTYSHYPMPEVCKMEDPEKIGGMRFVVGHTRARQLTSNFEKIPHLLIAGQTNSGKSTFLRQLITTSFLNNKDFEFTLIDLKEGLEFQLFENLEGVSVVANLAQASAKLRKFQYLLEKRMKLLKANKCKDLAAYMKLEPDKKTSTTEDGQKVSLDRHLIVIDEAADIFLAGSNAPSGDIQKARRVLVDVARKGRAVGLHLVFATQRPDSRSIDSQIKSNLPGIICFQMPNDASSIIVLGNGRATDLPPIPGRAIWKAGSDMIEVQTPLLTVEDAEELLKPHRTKKKIQDDDLNVADEADLGSIASNGDDNDAYDRA